MKKALTIFILAAYFALPGDVWAAEPGKTYWVQLLSAPSQLEALQAWDQLKAANPDILNGRRSSVSPDIDNKNQYIVRIGPIAAGDEAVGLCSALKGRGVDCRVLLYNTK